MIDLYCPGSISSKLLLAIRQMRSDVYREDGVEDITAYNDIHSWQLVATDSSKVVGAMRWLAHPTQSGGYWCEVQAWAVAASHRCSTLAIRMVQRAMQWGRENNARGIMTATLRHNSANILRRLGAQPISEVYFDARYQCEVQLLAI